MSTNREDFGTTFTVFVDTVKTLELTILDPDTGLAKSLADTGVYATGVVKIYKPDGTAVGATMPVSFTDRPTGKIEFTILDTSQTLAVNAGNWIGEVEFINTGGKKIDQQKFNMVIEESN